MMKILLTIIALFFTSLAWSQTEIKIYRPNFNSLSISENNCNLIDRVKYEKNTIFYKFQCNDTIKEFYFVNDSIYKYRELSNNKIIRTGQYQLVNKSAESSYHYPPGQYEEQHRQHIEGELVETGWWHEDQNKTSGRYWLGKREGTWETRNGKTKSKLRYKNDTLVYIYKPTEEHIIKYMDWLYNENLSICTDTLSKFCCENDLEIVDEKANCYKKNTRPQLPLGPTKQDSESLAIWAFKDEHLISLSYENKVYNYRVVSMSRERTKLRRVE